MTTRVHMGPIYRGATPFERRMMGVGVPARYIKCSSEDISGLTRLTLDGGSKKKVKSLDIAYQKTILSSIFDDTALQDQGIILAAASDPTDFMGMVLGAAVCRRALEMGLRPRMVNARKFPPRADMDVTRMQPDVVVIYDMTYESEQQRIESCRGWIDHYHEQYRIVIMAGCDPVSFCNYKLRRLPDAYIFMKDGGIRSVQDS